jgi:endonuclease/exonuclease/phosphatase family metal-dependent hydrolase
MTEPRTRIDRTDKDNPLQVDYLFASDGLIANPYVCGTLDQEEWAEYSDHAPVIATFEADSPGSEG